MDYAIQLANTAEGQTGVNPPVGAVVVKKVGFVVLVHT